MSGISKGGWHYLWCLCEDHKDLTAVPPKLIKIPVSAYVERVYDAASFSGLGIGS